VPEQRGFGVGGPTLADVGESGLLARILGAAGARGGVGEAGLLVGPGDDAAVWQPPPGRALVVTQDALVEGVDFHRDWTTPHLLGRRCIAVSLSDLAAMGARPAFCLVTLCAPADTPLGDVEALHGGIEEIAAEYACPLIGGDVSAIAGPLVIDVVAGGTVHPARVLRRDAGRPGDVLVVTGVLGRASAGLRLLRNAAASVPDDVAAAWRAAQLDPTPRLGEGEELAARGVRCAGDLSDGLLVDARRTAAASGCTAELWRDALPVDAALREAFGEESWLALAIAGGEDFELLAAVPPEDLDALLRDWPAGLAPLTVVGRLVEGDGVRLLDAQGGAAVALPQVSSRHFGS
jgi:thiamine-monophosphate kinase